ncbi:MAG: Gfo/Idh/MocA family oxidoreductase [Bacteroidetes bacterium]|nr:Gfo/Idh/MocA family oxidoreductase [Bacteroidota bacterium]
MEKKIIGIGFIGGGEISILHGRAIKEIENVRLVGLWNRTVSTGKRRAEEEGCRLFDSAEALVNDPDIQAVCILTNLETHLEYAKMAMEAGKDVLVEKPLCATREEVRELQKISKETGRLCLPGHNMIYDGSLMRTKKLMKNGDLGDLVSCYVMYNIYHNDERTSTLPGVIRQLLTHNLYTLMFVTGQRPVKAIAMKSNRKHPLQPDKEDLAMVIFQMESGGLAHLSVSFAADDLSPAPWTCTMKLIGTAGTGHYTYQDWVEVKKGISHSHTYTAYQDTITNEVERFVNLVRDGSGEILSTMEDALWAQIALEAAEESIRSETAVVISL